MASRTKVVVKHEEIDNFYSVYVNSDEAKCLKNDNNSDTMNIEYNINETTHDNCTSIPSEETGAFKWPHEAILLLLDEYNKRQNDFVSGKMSQKKVWSMIAAQMIKHGYNVTALQCLSKFSGLKRTYKAIKDHNNKPGNATRTWPYFSNMDTLLGSKPYMSVTTVSSTGKRTRSESDTSTSSVDSCLDTDDKLKYKKLRQVNSVEQLIQDLKEERKIAEERRERRHKEQCELREKLLNTLERMVDILSKK